MNKSLLVLFAMVFAAVSAQYEFPVTIQDHTASILSNDLPATVPSPQFSDYAAKVLGLPPRYIDSNVPMTNSLKRAEAVVTFITQDALPENTNNMKLVTPASKSLTARGALVQAVSGKNSCILDSTSVQDNIFTNQNSLVLSYAADENLADAFCVHNPTTPVPGRVLGSAVCATSDALLANTSTNFQVESNSLAAQVANPTNPALTLDLLVEAFPTAFKYDTENVYINNVKYSRENTDLEALLKDLTYITNISNKLFAFAAYTKDGNVDSYTFALTSVNSVTDNEALLAFTQTVVNTAVQKFATQYNNSLLSQVITSPTLTQYTCLSEVPRVNNASTLPSTTLTAENEGVTVEEVRHYQVTLWLTIALIVIALAGFTTTMNMHILPDAALVGGVSTYWTQKRG